jgi:hypothetical protein
MSSGLFQRLVSGDSRYASLFPVMNRLSSGPACEVLLGAGREKPLATRLGLFVIKCFEFLFAPNPRLHLFDRPSRVFPPEKSEYRC